ncbi:succinyl-diaminopimelate desuccinylase [Paracoccus sp. S-4012]|uniref:succinyl-diaminopimelate desuccinylase n=1 Tax=Paracoccus sp. S-4012 TaxID=2665648 RepID=UPI0012AFD393|nr:succinyl-diaminopimelate desuccinylase [Paracoccus sp. S-4012]MRX49212.1 succinyl-diaminopimelate desuccinylase [Paracoccus sp. S-4012]
MTNAADLTASLIRCPSVTPEEGGALTLLGGMLEGAGFEVHRCDRNGVPNLFARWGAKGAERSLGFNGHTDVVPPGHPSSWTHPPFSGHRDAGLIWGRGATDMKSGVAAWVSAACDFVREAPPAEGALIVTITGDEEGPAADGTRAILDWMAGQGERMSACVVGEPTCPERFGDMMKIGRRGSTTFEIEARGKQGHAAYPDRARNPVHALIRLLADLTAAPLDEGTAHFEPSGLQVVTVDVGNPAANVIPETARATVNIRFNDAHTSASLRARLEAAAAEVEAATGVSFTLAQRTSGESFVTEPGPFVDLVRETVREVSGIEPVLSTSGGTSDARFIHEHCPVVEFGLVGRGMHEVDERVPEAEIEALKQVYLRIMQRYLA